MFPGVTDYGNYNGYNLRYVPDLHRALVHYGWSASSSGQWCGSAGQVSHSSTLKCVAPVDIFLTRLVFFVGADLQRR